MEDHPVDVSEAMLKRSHPTLSKTIAMLSKRVVKGGLVTRMQNASRTSEAVEIAVRAIADCLFSDD
eukprot:5019644-Alexandrium_andersonii.AAC.1